MLNQLIKVIANLFQHQLRTMTLVYQKREEKRKIKGKRNRDKGTQRGTKRKRKRDKATQKEIERERDKEK